MYQCPSPSAAEEIQQHAQDDTDDHAGHDGEVETPVFARDVDIARQMSERQEFPAELHKQADDEQDPYTGQESSDLLFLRPSHHSCRKMPVAENSATGICFDRSFPDSFSHRSPLRQIKP